jgi:GNAT superfamily N-acetyltransferase
MIHSAGMACTFERIPSAPPIPKGVKVAFVKTLPSLVRLTTERRQRHHQGRNLLARLNVQRVRCFSATADGLPVGETELFLVAGVAGIYNVEVLRPYRRRGIGSLLLHSALQHAKQLGYRIATLGATGMGQCLYEHSGFEEVCKLSFWKYPKTHARNLA